MKKKIISKIRGPTTGIEPLPLRWETAIQPNSLWGMHKEIGLKAIIYLMFENFKVLAENLQQT